MNISSLIKVFGIAAAGFVPQAQANPFGISFVKIALPDDKKEEAICFRLKLSQTDVFSEHNFTDITFRPDTTVFLQKNTVIDDEEEILKKTFKNFNCEKDPFEIPEKYLPLEDKDRAEWVDKDGKPLKFLVVVALGGVYSGIDYRYRGGDACLCISGKSKQSVFYVDGGVTFIDGLDCVMCTHPFSIGYNLKDGLKKLKLQPKQKIGCMLSKEAMHYSLDTCAFQNVQVVLHHADGEHFQFYHVPSGSYVEGKMDSTKIRCPFFEYKSCRLEQINGEALGDHKAGEGDIVVIFVWNASQKSAKYSKIRLGSGVERDVTIVNKGEWIISVDVLREREKMHIGFKNSFTGGSTEDLYKLITEDKVDHEDKVKLSLKVHAFGFFFQKEQDQPNK